MTESSKIIFALCLFWGMHASARDQLKLCESRGGLLYSTHCSACHTSEVHWCEEEITAVAHYLNAVYYGFPVTDQKGYSQDEKPYQSLRNK